MTSNAVAIRDALEKSSENLAPLLPATIPPAKFLRIVYDAINRNPELKECRPQSVVDACAAAAKDGLVLDGREAALVIYKKYKKDRYGKVLKDDQGRWIEEGKDAQYIPMVLGLRKRMYATGQISTMETGIVYQKEIEEGRFEWQAGTDAFLRHSPWLGDDLGPPVAVYSVVTMSNHTKSVEVMRWSEVLAIAKRQSKNIDKDGNLKGIWKTDLGEMGRKTVLRRHSKQLPFDSDLATTFERIDGVYRDPDEPFSEDEIETENAPAGKKAGAAREKLRQARMTETPPHDRETGEIIEDAEIVNSDDGEEHQGDVI